MAEDWKVGDLALVVNKSVITLLDASIPHNHTGEVVPPVGTIHEVSAVRPSVLKSGRECGCIVIEFGQGQAALDKRCIKVTPEAEDEFDRETLLLEKKAAKKKSKEMSR